MTGAGDRRGLAQALRASGDRPAPIRATRVELLNLEHRLIAIATIVTDDRPPEVVMFEGEPFLRAAGAVLTYRQARTFRADALIEDLRA